MLITLTVSTVRVIFISNFFLKCLVLLTRIFKKFIANLSTNFLITFDSYLENIKIIVIYDFLALIFDKLAKNLSKLSTNLLLNYFNLVKKILVRTFLQNKYLFPYNFMWYGTRLVENCGQQAKRKFCTNFCA